MTSAAVTLHLDTGMIERPFTPYALRYVLEHLWPRGVEELRLLGLTREAAYARFARYAQPEVGYALVLEFDGVPAVVFGVAREDETFTWFQATDAFERHAREITRHIRRKVRAYPSVQMSIYSVCVHPDTARWFRVLGFAPTGVARELPSGALLRQFERV